jgi:hypothetical protein
MIQGTGCCKTQPMKSLVKKLKYSTASFFWGNNSKILVILSQWEIGWLKFKKVILPDFVFRFLFDSQYFN